MLGYRYAMMERLGDTLRDTIQGRRERSQSQRMATYFMDNEPTIDNIRRFADSNPDIAPDVILRNAPAYAEPRIREDATRIVRELGSEDFTDSEAAGKRLAEVSQGVWGETMNRVNQMLPNLMKAKSDFKSRIRQDSYERGRANLPNYRYEESGNPEPIQGIPQVEGIKTPTYTPTEKVALTGKEKLEQIMDYEAANSPDIKGSELAAFYKTRYPDYSMRREELEAKREAQQATADFRRESLEERASHNRAMEALMGQSISDRAGARKDREDNKNDSRQATAERNFSAVIKSLQDDVAKWDTLESQGKITREQYNEQIKQIKGRYSPILEPYRKYGLWNGWKKPEPTAASGQPRPTGTTKSGKPYWVHPDGKAYYEPPPGQ